jgi:hypothetical protein
MRTALLVKLAILIWCPHGPRYGRGQVLDQRSERSPREGVAGVTIASRDGDRIVMKATSTHAKR